MAERTESRRPVNLDKDLLAILCCPDTKQDVSLADEALIAKLNEAVSSGQLKNKANKPVAEPLDGGLIRADRKMLYPIRRSEEHTSELQSLTNLVCRLLLEKKK